MPVTTSTFQLVPLPDTASIDAPVSPLSSGVKSPIPTPVTDSSKVTVKLTVIAFVGSASARVIELTSGGSVSAPVHCTTNVYGSWSESLLATDTVAVRGPIPLGSHAIVKVSDPPAGIGSRLGCVATEKSPDPESATYGNPVRSKPAAPLLRIVNVRETGEPGAASPKSVWSLDVGVVSPSAITVPFPSIAISGTLRSTTTSSKSIQKSPDEISTCVTSLAPPIGVYVA